MYDLMYSFQHCGGTIERLYRQTESLSEADEWAAGNIPHPDIEKVIDVTGANCPVEFCPMKMQKPVYFYRESMHSPENSD